MWGTARPVSFRSPAVVAAVALSLAFAVAIPLDQRASATTAPTATPATTTPADTAPPSGTPATVSADPLPTVQIDGVVWSQVTVGNTVYATGSFDKAWPAGQAEGGSGTVSVGNLIAYNITTGVMISSFNHVLNAQGLAITASPSGSLVYVGGDFTTVDGVARGHVAAFDTATGALDTTWTPNVYSEVAALSATKTTVYLGGQFFQVNGVTRTRLAAVNATTGALLSWAPSADDAAVSSVLASPDGSTVDVGGRFTTLNGVTARGLGAVSASSGATVSFAINKLIQNYGDGSEITSLSTDGTNGYLTGYTYKGQGGTGDFEGTAAFNPDTGAVVWIDDCHGDSYDAYPIGQILYSVSHAHDCSAVGDWPDPNPRVWHRSLAETTYATGTDTGPDTYGWNYNGQPDSTVLNWFPALTAGTFTGQGQAAWSVTGNANYVAEGGEFPKVNNVAQQGLVRFAVSSIAPNKTGPLANTAAMTPTVISLSPGTARVAWTTTWDYDNAVLTYKVFRDGSGTPIYTTTAASNFWQVSSLGFTDTGLTPGSTHTYLVRAYDPYGNTTNGASTSVTIASSTQGGAYVGQVRADGASNLWRLDEPTGTTAYDWAGYTDLTTTAGVTGGAPGPLTSDPVTADTFTGTATSTAAVSQLAPAPATFTIEGWVKTTTKTGGTIIDYADNPTALSTTQDNTVPNDRTLYMDNAGHLLFGVVTGSSRSKKTIASTATYNNGAYHYVVATLSSAGMQLFVDGTLVAQNSTVTTAAAHNGYWRLGGDALTGWTSAPKSSYFAGTLADVAIYPAALSAAQVAAHYGLATGTLTAPTAAFTPTCTALTCSFDATASSSPNGAITNYAWNFGDGTTATGATTSHTYAAAGTYSVTLTVTDSQAVIGTSTQSVTATTPVGNTPYATDSFNRTVASGWGTATTGGAWSTGGTTSVTPGSGTLTLAKAGATSNAWLTNLSTTDSETTVTLAANKVGTGGGTYLAVQGRRISSTIDYRARLRLLSNNTVAISLLSENAGTEKILAGEKVLSGVTVTPGEQFDVDLQVTGTSPTTLNLNVWPASQAEPAGWQLTATDSTAALQAAGSVGIWSYLSGSATNAPVSVTASGFAASPTGVTPPANQPPVAAFTPSCTNLACTFSSNGSYDPDGTIASYAWTFGDGATATGPSPAHTYTAGGSYPVTLTVTDNQGATGTTTSTVTVAPASASAYATDSFDRTVASGWGTADTGGAWSTGGTTSVTPGAGTLTLSKTGTTSNAWLTNLSTTNSETTVTLAANKVGTGGGTYLAVQGRRISSTIDYRARLRLLSNNTVAISLLSENAGTEKILAGEKVLSGVTVTPGEQFDVDLQVTGTSPTTLNLNVWPASQAEPAGWQLTATDSTAALQAAGSVGIWSYLSGSATNAPVAVQAAGFSTGPST